MAMTRMVLATGPNAPFKSFQEMVDYAKANPAKIKFSSTGADDPRLFSEAIRQQFGLDLVHVAFKGTAEAVTALLSNDIQLVWVAPSRVLDGNGLRPLVTTGSARIEQLPDVPTSTELQLTDIIDPIFDLFVPSATPDAVVAQISDALDKIAVDPKVVERIQKAGMTVQRESPEATRQRINARIERVLEIARTAKIEPQ